jgi:hypothetical protein
MGIATNQCFELENKGISRTNYFIVNQFRYAGHKDAGTRENDDQELKLLKTQQ